MLLSLLAAVAFARSDIAVLVSDTLATYDAPVDRFEAAVGRPTTVYDLQGSRERADAIVKQLQADPPPLVYALGAKAAYAAVNGLPDVPVVYAMVTDPPRYGIGGTQVTGVSTSVPAEAVLSQFRLFAPDVKTIGVLLAASNTGGATADALAAAKRLGYDLKVQRVTNARDLRAAFDRMSGEVDALWLLPDPVALTPDGFRYLRTASLRYKIPMLASSETLVQAGALLCVAPDRAVLGQQAAELAQRVLDGGELPGSIAPPEPGSIRVVLNRDTLRQIGLEVDPILLDFAETVGREAEGR